jgi:hypothetical protein
VLGEVGRWIAEAAEIDQATHAGAARRLPERAGGPRVARMEIVAAPQAVHQVVGHLHAGQGRSQARFIQHVAPDDLDAADPRPALQAGGIAHHAADLVPGVEQARYETSPNVPSRPGHQHAHVGLLYLIRRRCRSRGDKPRR